MGRSQYKLIIVILYPVFDRTKLAGPPASGPDFSTINLFPGGIGRKGRKKDTK